MIATGVRTPMQWSDQRNSGFSDTDPEQLPLPVITNCQFGHQAVNVENQLRTPVHCCISRGI